MIRYALLCGRDHAFEAWFRDSEAYDRQSDAGQVTCPACASSEVRKAVMAPAVRRSSERRGVPSVPSAAEAEAPPSAVPAPEAAVAPIVDEQFARMRAALREVHARLKRDAENVGPAFPDRARAIHEGDEPPRAIYGTATDDEVRGLIEDGVGIMPLPALPDERN